MRSDEDAWRRYFSIALIETRDVGGILAFCIFDRPV